MSRTHRFESPSDADRFATQRAEIVDAALSIVTEAGPQALTTRRLAEAAGVTTMTIYSRFGGMESVSSAVFNVGFARLTERLRAVEPTGAAAQDVLECCRAYRRFGVENPGLYSIMFERAIVLDPESTSSAASESFDELAQRITRLVGADGKTATVRAHAYGLWALCHGLVNLETTGMGTSEQVADTNTTFDTAVSTFIDGLVVFFDGEAGR
jgi:AcrR family transcriptional regulator